MRIDELKSGAIVPMLKGTSGRREWDRDTRIEVPYDLRQWLDRHGYKILGSGGYSVVYVNGARDRVVKINQYPDPSWLGYAQYCLKRWKDNPHLPRVYGLKRYTWRPDQRKKPEVYFIAVLERLKKGRFPPWMDNAITMATQGDKLLKALPSGPSGLWGAQFARFRREYPKFYELLMALKRVMPRKSGWDVHSDNVMWRGSVPVLTDPFANVRR